MYQYWATGPQARGMLMSKKRHCYYSHITQNLMWKEDINQTHIQISA